MHREREWCLYMYICICLYACLVRLIRMCCVTYTYVRESDVYIYIYVYVRVHIFICIFSASDSYVLRDLYICVREWCIYIHIYIYVYVCICSYAYSVRLIRMCCVTYTYVWESDVYIYIYIYVRMHIFICIFSASDSYVLHDLYICMTGLVWCVWNWREMWRALETCPAVLSYFISIATWRSHMCDMARS